MPPSEHWKKSQTVKPSHGPNLGNRHKYSGEFLPHASFCLVHCYISSYKFIAEKSKIQMEKLSFHMQRESYLMYCLLYALPNLHTAYTQSPLSSKWKDVVSTG